VSVNDYYIGMEASALNADKFMLEYIDEDMRREEEGLYDTKWFDYRPMHPFHATMYFVHRYNVLAAAVTEREVGAKEAARLRARANTYDLRKLNGKRPVATIRAFWKARQAADAIGCPYDVYIRAAILNFRSNRKLFSTVKTAKHRQEMPYAVQLCSPFIVEGAITMWERDRTARFRYPESEMVVNKVNWFNADMVEHIKREAQTWPNPEKIIESAKRAGLILEP